MTYLEAVSLLHDIESKYDVMSIKYRGVSVWTFLRLRLLDRLSLSKEVKVSRGIIRIVLRSLFYGSLCLLRKSFDLWTFTSAERRKQVDNKMIHRISGAISHLPYKTLMVEKPNIYFGHYPKRQIKESAIISESWLLILNRILLHLTLVKNQDIENYQLMNKILKDYKLDFNYLYYIRYLVAQYKSMNVLLSVAKKPKLILFECPYDSMGYVWSFHEHGIKTIELQHGVLNKNHNAYNAKNYDLKLNPDVICVYGIEEYKYFKNEALSFTQNIEITGLYMLECADYSFTEDVFLDDRKLYKHIVLASGQTGFEEQLGKFVECVSLQMPDILFIYIPRNSNVEFSFAANNIRIVKNVNIYQFLKWADLHITISSTTCLEAHYFHKPTIFYNFQKMASSYYGHILKEENAVRYLGSEQGFEDAFQELLSQEFIYKEVFAHNHIKRLNDVIKNNLE